MGSPSSSEALLYMESDCAFPLSVLDMLPLLAPMGPLVCPRPSVFEDGPRFILKPFLSHPPPCLQLILK